MPSDRRKILRAIQRESRQIRDPKARKVFRRAAVQTGIVESGLRNLSYGDADSQNWRQEREQGYGDEWAKTGGPGNVKASVKRFRQEFQQHYSPGEKSYDVAAQVQRPREDLRGRYKDVRGQAEQILKGEVGSAPNRRQGTSYETKTTPGVDRSAERQASRLSYLANEHDPDALLNLGLSLRGQQDSPSKTTRTKVRAPKNQPNVKTGGGLVPSVQNVDRLASRYGAPITAKQEPGHATGGDHDPAVKGATARDIGGSEAQRKRIFKKLTRQLGVKGAVYKGADINVVKGGVRYQIISRDHGSGPHLHVGLRKTNRG